MIFSALAFACSAKLQVRARLRKGHDVAGEMERRAGEYEAQALALRGLIDGPGASRV